MTVLSACQTAAPVIGLQVPSQVFGSTQRELVELAAVANEMGRRIAEDHDWRALRKLATYTGTGSQEAFNLPPDYDRMLLDGHLIADSGRALYPVSNLDQWLVDEALAAGLPDGAWTMYGGQIHIRPPVADGATVRHWYVGREIIRSDQGDPKTRFTQDEDEFFLGDRILSLGLIWQWRANKGLPYAEDMQNYEDCKAQLIGRDGGRSIIRSGRRAFPSGATYPYPWPLGQ